MLNVLLIEQALDNRRLDDALQQCAAQTFKTAASEPWLSVVYATRPDMLLFNLQQVTETVLTDLSTLNRSHPLPVILCVEHADEAIIDKLIQADVSVLLLNADCCARLESIMLVAQARFRQLQALRHDLEDARSQLEDRKQIDRAKAILIKTQKFTEHEAYHTLRKLAMDRNITLVAMAKNVIAMAELLK